MPNFWRSQNAKYNKCVHSEDICIDGSAALHYITLHKIVFRVPKITRTTRTLYEIKGVMWEYSYEGKHLAQCQKFTNM